MKAERFIGAIFGLLAGVSAYLLFGFHFWQSLVIAWFVGLLFAFLMAILIAVKKWDS
jgi:ribose/xylose/arabinose/galactoside ABC-type transport system permease subunit